MRSTLRIEAKRRVATERERSHGKPAPKGCAQKYKRRHYEKDISHIYYTRIDYDDPCGNIQGSKRGLRSHKGRHFHHGKPGKRGLAEQRRDTAQRDGRFVLHGKIRGHPKGMAGNHGQESQQLFWRQSSG